MKKIGSTTLRNEGLYRERLHDPTWSRSASRNEPPMKKKEKEKEGQGSIRFNNFR